MNAIVQRMSPSQRYTLRPHFAALPPDDLRLRFGTPMNEGLLEKYVEGIDFSNDAIFGIFDEDHALAGMAHLRINAEGVFAELGLSVHPRFRGIGYGTALLKKAALHATHCGIPTLYMQSMAGNSVMIHLAQKLGLRVIMERDEAGLYMWLRDPYWYAELGADQELACAGGVHPETSSLSRPMESPASGTSLNIEAPISFLSPDSKERKFSMMSDIIRDANTEPEIYFLLTAYIEAVRFGDELNRLSEHLTKLPLCSLDDLKERSAKLVAELDVASRRLDDRACEVIKEGLEIFGAALTRLESFERASQPQGPARQSTTRPDMDARDTEASGIESLNGFGTMVEYSF